MKMKKTFQRNLLSLLLIFAISLTLPQTASAANSPAAVKNLKCGVTTSNSINISWTPQGGVSGYHVFRAVSYDGPYVKIKTIAAGNNAFCNMKLQGGREYYYRVRSYVNRNGRTVNGKLSKILSARTKGASKAATTRARANVRKHAGTNHPVLTTLNTGTKVTIVCSTKDKSGADWSRITYTQGGQKKSGYISSNLLSIGQSSKKYGIVTANSGLRLRRSASVSSGIITTLAKGTKVTILGQTIGTDKQKWYRISVKKSGRTLTGYAAARYIRVS